MLSCQLAPHPPPGFQRRFLGTIPAAIKLQFALVKQQLRRVLRRTYLGSSLARQTILVQSQGCRAHSCRISCELQETSKGLVAALGFHVLSHVARLAAALTIMGPRHVSGALCCRCLKTHVRPWLFAAKG